MPIKGQDQKIPNEYELELLIDQFVKERREESRKKLEKNKRIKEMVSNFDYINWLIGFVQDKDGFSDDDWLYHPEELSQDDLKKVNELSLFFEGIQKYANENYYHCISCDFGGYYKIRLDENGFEIYCLHGQGTAFIIKKIAVDNDEEFINLKDVIDGKRAPGALIVDKKIEELSAVILSLREFGVPDEAVEEIVDKAELRSLEITRKRN